MSVELLINKILVIDFSLFTQGDPKAKQTIVKQIYYACHRVGFMYFKNHDKVFVGHL